MSTVAAFFVFVLVMLALATLAIILDWMGKPIRRTFRPRTAGTPGWLMVDTPVLPESPEVDSPHHPVGRPAEIAAFRIPFLCKEIQRRTSHGRPGIPSSSSLPEEHLPRSPPCGGAIGRTCLSASSSEVFGEANRILMTVGQPPQRFNARTRSIEELNLPEDMLRNCWVANRKPTPTWGDKGLDPFARQ